MYNHSLNLKYREIDSDTQYRKEVLEVFGMDEYTDSIIDNKINILQQKVGEFYNDVYPLVEKYDKLASILGITKEHCFIILFSWEFFYENHAVLNAIFEKKPNDVIQSHINELKKVIQKNTKK
jgi:hypothetical protein